MTTVGNNIRNLRERKGLTQYELAERAGVTQSHISLCENGAKMPSVKLCQRLAAVFDCPLSSVLDTSNERRAV